jgi:hypothetical protein
MGGNGDPNLYAVGSDWGIGGTISFGPTGVTGAVTGGAGTPGTVVTPGAGVGLGTGYGVGFGISPALIILIVAIAVIAIR